MPEPKDDQQRIAKEFHEKSLEAARAEQERIEAARERRKEGQASFEEQGKQFAAEQDAQALEKKEDMADWRKREAANKEAIAADKARRQKEQDEIKRKQEEKAAFDKKKGEYMESLHDAAAEQAKAEKAAFEREQTRKRLLQQAETEAREQKLQADAHERQAKQELDKEILRRKDELERGIREELATIHSKEVQTTMRLDLDMRQNLLRTPASQAGERARITQDAKMKTANAEREAAKARGDMQAKLTGGKRQLEMELIKRKTDLERATRQKHNEIDTALTAKKVEINKEYGN